MFRAGVDLGGTKIQVAVLDQQNKVLGTHRCATPTEGGPAAVTDAIAVAVRAAAEAGSTPAAQIVGVGVGAPGQIDVDAGTVSNAGNLPNWMITYPLGSELSQRLDGVPVAIANDVQVAVNAELRLGAGQEFDSLIGVFCGTGVGGGLVIDNELWLGRGAAGEIGHVCIDAGKNGAPCTCGRTGCMEAYAGRAAMEIQARKWVQKGRRTELFKIMKKKKRERLASGVWDAALKENDKMATKLVNRAIWALGAGVGSSVNLTDVEAVIVGGGLGVRLGQPFADKIAAAMKPHLIKPDQAPPVIVAALGDLGGAIGAALLVSNVEAMATDRKRAPLKATKSVAKRAVAVGATKKTPTTKSPAKKAPAKKAPVKKVPVKKAMAAKVASTKVATTKAAIALAKAPAEVSASHP